MFLIVCGAHNRFSGVFRLQQESLLLPLPAHVYNGEFWSGAEACCRVRQTTHSQFDRQVLQLLDTERSQVYQFGGNISWSELCCCPLFLAATH